MRYPDSESKYLEFKERVSRNTGYRGIAKECVAFANGVGGKVVIGVEDGTCEVVGLTEEEANQIMEVVAEAIFSLVTPPLQVLAKRLHLNSKHLVEVTIPRGLSEIHRLTFECDQANPLAGVYVRVGRSSIPVKNQEQYDTLLAEKRRPHCDEKPIPIEVSHSEILSRTELEKAYGNAFTDETLIANRILHRSPLNHETFHPSLSAVVAFAHRPADLLPEALIRVSHMRGRAGRQIITTRDISAPMHLMIEQSLQLIAEWTESNFQLVDAAMKGTSPIPEVALREALVNAVVHRKYQYIAPIKVAIYQDRIEIFSPGDLPPPMLPENIGDGSSQLRNFLLAKLARRLRLIESLGSGIAVMRDECRKRGLNEPEFDNQGDYFKVIFRFLQMKSVKISPAEIIAELAKHQDIITASDLVSRGAAMRTATRALKQACDDGILQRIGERKGAKYLVNPIFREPTGQFS